jgi:hypothetical protein
MDLPRFVIIFQDSVDCQWEILATAMKYEQAREALLLQQSRGYQCYLAGLTFIAWPYTDTED